MADRSGHGSNGSSHRSGAAVQRRQEHHPDLVLAQALAHTSRLNQVEMESGSSSGRL